MNNIAFIGCGGIAKSHACSLDNLKYYYPDLPVMNKRYVASRNIVNSQKFQAEFGFQEALTIDELFKRIDYNTVFILTDNLSHCEYLLKALQIPHIQNIYLEKPVCCSQTELDTIKNALINTNKNIQVGFQYLQMAALRQAYTLWNTLDFGTLISFSSRYLHGEYLNIEYRNKRRNRLLEAPYGGALVDLGSHAMSLLVKFLGSQLNIQNAYHSGGFADVPQRSDLSTLVNILDSRSGAIGTLSASRIHFASGDQLELELFASNGALKFSTHTPDILSYSHTSTNGNWLNLNCGNNFNPHSSFPSINVPAGWLRSLMHAHYLFLSNNQEEPNSGIEHSILVQQLILDSVKKFSE